MNVIKYTFGMCLFCILAGCIGTDLVDKPLAPKPAEIKFEPIALTLLVADSATVKGTVFATDGSILDLPIQWESADESVGTVDGSGKVIAISKGQTWIIASADSYTDSLFLTVVENADEVASVDIEGERNSIEIDEQLQLTAVVRNVSGDVIPSSIVNWSSTDDAVVSVDNQGLVTGKSAGIASVIAESEGVESEPFVIEVGGMVIERSGMFSGLNGYSASGTAVLRVDGDDKSLIFESDFSTQNGPGLFIYLSPSGDSVAGGISLGAIKSTSGMQTYEIPSSEDTDQYQFVIIYCQPFGVLFGNAELQ